MANRPYSTRLDAAKGGAWHIYPGGRQVFVKKRTPVATAGPGRVGPGAAGLAQPRPVATAGPGRVGPGAAGLAQPRATTPGLPGAPAKGPKALPVDPGYDAQVGALSNTYEAGVAGIAGQRDRGLKGFGFNEANYNPATGTPGKLTFDSNNPFSKAALLKRNYDTERRSTGQAMGSTGQLYAGAYQKSQDVINRGQMQGQDELQKSLIDFLAGNSADYAQNGGDYALGVGQARGEAMSRALEDPNLGAEGIARGVKPKPKPKPASHANRARGGARPATARVVSTHLGPAAAALARPRPAAKKNKKNKNRGR